MNLMTSYWVHKIKVHDDDPFEDIKLNLMEIIRLTSIICVILFRLGNRNGIGLEYRYTEGVDR